MDKKLKQETIVNYLKNYGFVYPNSEIYNGLANAWDFGPLGVLLKNNIKQLWWKTFVTTKHNIVGLDSAIIYNPTVWKASGHLANFSDPLVDCKNCKKRYRADKLIEEFASDIDINENASNQEFENILKERKIVCPNCQKQEWTPIRKFNLMFKTHDGVIESDESKLYLRPETAQGIFINFKNVQRTTRQKLPFGIAQIGKAFRNEITPGNFIFRTKEFEQMELEYFCFPEQSDIEFEKLLLIISIFLKNVIKLDSKNLKLYEHDKAKLSHYSKRTVDYEFNFAHGWGELWGVANRSDYDLKVHQEFSKSDLTYLDPITNKKILPHVIEPSVGVERLFYAIITQHYHIETLNDGQEREVLSLPYKLSPYKVAILPLTNKLKEQAESLFDDLLENEISVIYDASGSIGKRYRRQDAIGTPLSITIDFDYDDKKTVTIRNRDTMQQETIPCSQILEYLQNYERLH